MNPIYHELLSGQTIEITGPAPGVQESLNWLRKRKPINFIRRLRKSHGHAYLFSTGRFLAVGRFRDGVEIKDISPLELLARQAE